MKTDDELLRLAEWMEPQEKCDYLATELMGLTVKDERGHFHVDRVGRPVPWNPLKSEADCMECAKKIGEMGLGEHYAAILFRPIHTEHCTMTMDEKKDTAKTSAKLLYDYLTLPLQTRVEAMIKVVKNWHMAENKMWTGEGDNEPA